MRTVLVPFARYLNIIWFKVYANLKAETEKMYLGSLWWVIEPMLNTAVLYLVFKVIRIGSADNLLVLLYVGAAIFSWFSASVTMGANALVTNAALMQQVQLPKWIFPVIAVANQSWKFLFSLVIVFPFLWAFHLPPTSAYLALPALVFTQAFTIIGLSLLLCVVIPFFPDGRTVLASGMNLLMWLSGIFYQIDKVAPEHQGFFVANPAAMLVDGFRAVLMDGRWPEARHFVSPLLFGAVSGGLGWFLLHRLGNRIAKIPV